MTAVFDTSTFLVAPRRAPAPHPDFKVYASGVRIVPPVLRAARRARQRVRARELGLAYEQRVADVLSAIYGDRFVRSPTIAYVRRAKLHYAVPDGILYLDGEAVVTEVKLAHTELVWPQLVTKYRALVRLLHPTLRVRTVEICRSYDPAVPVAHSRITSLHSGALAPAGLEVLLWRI